MIDKKTLLIARVLATVAYTGLLLVLPRPIARRFWDLADAVSEEIVGVSLDTWAADVVELVVEKVAP